MDEQMPRRRSGAAVGDGTAPPPRVVVGVDGSEGARAALRYALLTAARRGADLDVVAAYPAGLPWRWDPQIDAPDVEAVRADLEARAHAFGADVRAATPGVADVPVTVFSAPGPAAHVLVERAEGADLLVVGNRGRGAVRSAVLGSVALHAVAGAGCPVVVVPQVEEGAAGSVVVGVDGSPGSTTVLRAAGEEALRLGAALHVVAAYGSDDHWSEAHDAGAPAVEQIRESAERRVEALVREFRTAAAGWPEGPPTVTTEVVQGSPHDVLAERSAGARLLVVGRHGHGVVRGLLLGSVALHSVVHARCPVLVVAPAPVREPASDGQRQPVAG